MLSLVGAQRVNLDLTGMEGVGRRSNFAMALTTDALYEVLEGKPMQVDRNDGAINLCPDGNQLIIQQEGRVSSHRVWMSELALAWNMLAGVGTLDRQKGRNVH